MKFQEYKNSFLNETLYKGVHKSGLTVVILKKPDFDKFYSVISTKYGSNDVCFKNEDMDEFVEIPDGIAHFLEHKMFEQPDGTNAFDKFSEYGANANAFTSFNNTAYLYQCTDFFYENLSHLLDYVFSPYFTEENVAKEQGIIGQEIRMYDDDPEWRVMFNMLKAMYVNHPIRRDIAGTVESISKIDKDLLYYCYNIFYHPENMILFMTGNIDIDKIPEILDKNVPVKEKPFNAVIKEYSEPDRVNSTEIIEKLAVSIPMFSMGYKDVRRTEKGKETEKRCLVTDIAVKLLIGDGSSLYKNLYESGLINDSFYSDITVYNDYAFVQFASESKNPGKVRELIFKEVEKMKKDGPDKKAFERIKKSLYGKYIKAFNKIETIGNSFCHNFFMGIDLFDFLEVYDTITYDDIVNEFEELFKEDMFVTSLILPKDTEEK